LVDDIEAFVDEDESKARMCRSDDNQISVRLMTKHHRQTKNLDVLRFALYSSESLTTRT